MTIGAKHQGGWTLIETMLSAAIMAPLLLYAANVIRSQAQQAVYDQYGSWMSAYVNAVTGYMVQNPTAPAILTRNGTDWLKPNTCGGIFAPADAFLSCDVPTNFNNPYTLPAPTVTFTYGTANPKADISFGVVKEAGAAAPLTAAKIVASITHRITVNQGYQNVEVFAAADNSAAELQSANIRARIDNSLASDIHLRLDGSNQMTAPVLSRSTTWAMIARDNGGNENAAAKDPQSSINVNDVFNRSTNSWLSETQDLAEEAYALAVRSPQFMSEVPDGSVIQKPSCPGTLAPQIFTDPPIFIGGPNPSDARLISGVRTPVQDIGSAWVVHLYTLYEGSTGWQPTPASMGRVKVTVRCSG